MPETVSVIILAAGLGTRMRSRRAKVLHRAGGLCLLEHVVRAALTVAEPENVTAVVGHQAELVRAEVERYGIRFAVQTEQKGTGHAVLQAADTPGVDHGLVVVLYGDCPLLAPETLRRLLAAHQASGSAATLITTHLDNPTGYGRIVQDEAGRVAAIVEEKAASPDVRRIREINSGIYCFSAAALWPRLGALKPNPASGEIYLTDIVESLRRDGLYTARCVVEDAKELLGINNRVELAEADQIFRARKVRELQEAGVTIEKPDTVTLDLDVQAGADSVIEAFAQLLGDTRIGEDCRVGACSILRDSHLSDGVTVHPFCHIQGAQVAAGAIVGPFARLRPGSEIGAAAHIGNFVELKKTKLGAGAKANHLAYLGDSEIGVKANIGAGTITCNYDGHAKHRTTIGAGAFVGSNATLVAPVEIGDGSYVGAASVITKDVPADALAVGRAHQLNKEGWAKKRRADHKTSKG